MSLHDHIFSNARNHRLIRHLTFWLGWVLFAGLFQVSFTPRDFSIINGPSHLFHFQLLRSANRLPAVLIFSYFVVYFLVPRFLPGRKYFQFTFYFICSFLVIWFFTALWLYYAKNVFHTNSLIPANWPIRIIIFNAYYSNINFTGALPACVLMLAIKYYKDWYKRQRESEILLRENAQVELQMLKAQVHPHFLFNTLNNIYSFTLTGNPNAAELVDKLSGMIDYMRTEGAKNFVEVEKEIQLLKDYMGLEKVRYGDRLDMQLEIGGDYKNRMIAPMLMIPFAENSFKHGASTMRGRQWVRLRIKMDGPILDFRLSNSKPPLPVTQNGKKGIGLANARKRLELLYPDEHVLEIDSTDDIYSVHMRIALEHRDLSHEDMIPRDHASFQTQPQLKPFTYA